MHAYRHLIEWLAMIVGRWDMSVKWVAAYGLEVRDKLAHGIRLDEGYRLE